MSIADARSITDTCATPASTAPRGTPTVDEQATVIGPNAAVYLGPAHVQPWRWPFLAVAAIPWFFYRKMYIAGAVSLLAGFMLAIHAPLALLAFALLKGIAAQPLYRRFVRSRIAKADARALAGTDRQDYLRRAGGTSPTAAIFAFSIILPLLLTAAYLTLIQLGWL